ncbi:MAG TPA: hypothetical protein PK593_09560 [Thermomicrobiales bacterium]|nr:hypothetical protein [Chloroflexota bacterium]HQX63689.1 hypothetical protein [Thermomicrobiales bacterium]HQZ89648.1 hypothetical protein [Thermomicrobiales bacterium]HRA30620.1 hypothetical protein [Thermomicrobiales bacterium]
MARPISPPLYWSLIALQWLAVTLMHGAVVIWSSRALERYISPHQSTLLFLISAFVGAVLLGLTTRRVVVLGILTLLFCIVGAAFLGVTIYSPAWEGTIARVVSVQNYATQQALFVLVWSALPAALGALAGFMAGAELRQGLEPRDPDQASPWWERRAG